MATISKTSIGSPLSGADRGPYQGRGVNQKTEAKKNDADSLASELIDIEEQVMSGALERAAALVEIAEVLGDVAGVDGAMITLQQGEDLVCCASAGDAPSIGSRMSSRSGVYSECLAAGRMIRCDNAKADSHIGLSTGVTGSESMILLPLMAGKLRNGVLAIFSGPNALGSEHITAFGTAATLATLIAMELKLAQPEPTLDEALPSTYKGHEQHDGGLDARFGTVGTVNVPEQELQKSANSGADANRRHARAAENVATVLRPKEKARTSGGPRLEYSNTAKPSVLKPKLLAVLLILCSGVLFAGWHSLRRGMTPARSDASLHAKGIEFDVAEVAGRPLLATRSTTGTAEISGGTSIQRPSPTYPQLAIKTGVQGDVAAVLSVTEAGVVADVETSGNSTLAEATTAALAHWRYTPFKVGGQPVAVKIPVTVSFRLNAR
jgi:TonB family protein